MQIADLPTEEGSYKIAKHDKIVETDLNQYASSLQAIFMNVKWQTKFSPEGVNIEDLVNNALFIHCSPYSIEKIRIE